MILSHGANSIGGDNYILDDFVALYNGVYNSGLSINHGSFGGPISDPTCPIKGASCFDLSDITNDNTLAKPSLAWYYQSELNTLFSSSTWTFDCWIKYAANLGTAYVRFGNANSSGQSDFAYIQLNSISTYTAKIFGSSISSQPIGTGWHHFALVNGSGIFLDGINVSSYKSGSYGGKYSIYIEKISNSGIRIANIALRNYAVWTENFTPPVLLYKQI